MALRVGQRCNQKAGKAFTKLRHACLDVFKILNASCSPRLNPNPIIVVPIVLIVIILIIVLSVIIVIIVITVKEL